MNRELLLYHRQDYNSLKKYYTDKAYCVESFSKIISSSNSFDRIENYNKIVLDISSISYLINSSEYTLSILEQFIYYLDFEFEDCNNIEVKFISDYKNDDIFYKLRYCFDTINEYKNYKIVKYENRNDDNNNIKIKKIVDINEDELDIFFEKFEKLIYGHIIFKNNFRNSINIFRLFNKLGEDYILSFFLMGPSGVGKTEVARAIHKSLGGNKNFIKINFGNYSSKDSLNSLIGSPRGYIGSENGELFDKLVNSDSGIILIDEFEKADNKIFNYFLELLETGKATNSQGIEFDLNGYIIIFTSNIKESEFYIKFSPELISRFNYIYNFEYLTLSEKTEYIANRVNEIIDKYKKVKGDIIINHQEIIDNVNKNLNNIRDLNLNIRNEFYNYINSRFKQ